jgi:hypothetical protein
MFFSSFGAARWIREGQPRRANHSQSSQHLRLNSFPWLKFASGIKHVDVARPRIGSTPRHIARLVSILPIAKYPDSCYHRPFLYDDAKDAISRSPGCLGTNSLRTSIRPTNSVAQACPPWRALLFTTPPAGGPLRSCKAWNSTHRGRRIATGIRPNRKSGIRIQPKS